MPSVVELDLAGLFYALWSPNAAVVEGAVKLMLTPSEDALWGMSQLVNASTPVAYAANASAFQTLPPCNSGTNLTVGIASATPSAAPSPSATPSATPTPLPAVHWLLSAPAGSCDEACAANSSSCTAAALAGFPVNEQDMAAIIASMGLDSSFCDIYHGNDLLPEDPEVSRLPEFGQGLYCYYGGGIGVCAANASNTDSLRFCPCSYAGVVDT